MRNYLYIAVVLLYTGCTKLTDTPPSSTTQPALDPDRIVTGLMLGTYEEAGREQGLLNGLLAKLQGLAGDELDRLIPFADESAFLHDTVHPSNRFLPPLWAYGYRCIAPCNTVLAASGPASTVNSPLQEYLQGEALFFRSLCFLYLANLFGGIPLVVGTDPLANAQLPRASETAVYDQLLSDLLRAEQLLPLSHPQADSDAYRRTRPELGAAQALLARVCLYRGHYAAAERYASQVISSHQYALADSLPLVFVPGSEEVIFQLKPVTNNYNTAEATNFSVFALGKPVYALTTYARNAFEHDDKRLLHWFHRVEHSSGVWYRPYKYKVTGGPPYREYNVVLRLGEQFLIRAEARARQGDLAGALADLGVLRRRAGLSLSDTLVTPEQVLLAVARERQTELSVEWGHRFLDLKRWYLTHPPGDVLHDYARDALTAKPRWQAYKLLLPLPADELVKNRSLIQNPHY